MSRWVFGLLLAASLMAQNKETKPPEPPQEQAPPEEDESAAPKVYSFNPLQAAKELKIGNFYFKKGSYRAAAMRYEEATRWDQKSAEAWLRLGEAQERLKDRKAARQAYSKYLDLAPDAKNAEEIRKRVSKLGTGG